MLVSIIVCLLFALQEGLIVAAAASTNTPSIPPRHGVPVLSLHKAGRKKSFDRREVGISQVTLSSDDESYYTLISAGNISFRVALDTASSDLWLLSSSCTSSVCKSVPTYPLSYSSPSFVSVNGNATSFNVSFADGTGSSGFLARESVQLQNFTVANQIFGLVDSSNVTLENEVSGVLGLGFPRLSSFSSLTANATPFVDALVQQGQFDYPLFGFSLTRNDSGTLALGAIDASVVKNASAIEWHDVTPFSPFGAESNSSSYLQWVIRMSNITVNGTVVAPQPTYPNDTKSSLALFDVGTNGIFGPFQDVSRIFNLLSESRLVNAESGLWALPCDTTEVMSFSFGGQNFTLQPTDYLIGPASGNPNLCLSWPQATSPSSDGIDWQFGHPFLRTVYSIFSYGIDTKEPPIIGLYALNNASSLTETQTDINSFFSSASATIATTLPNFPLSTATPTTPSYIFNTSVPASLGQIVSTGLGNSTYSPLLTASNVNATAIPTVLPSPTLVTLVLTDSAGVVITSTSHASTPTIKLGTPPGASAGFVVRVPAIPACVLSLGVGLFILPNIL